LFEDNRLIIELNGNPMNKTIIQKTIVYYLKSTKIAM